MTAGSTAWEKVCKRHSLDKPAVYATEAKLSVKAGEDRGLDKGLDSDLLQMDKLAKFIKLIR